MNEINTTKINKGDGKTMMTLVHVPSSFVVLVGVVVHLGAGERVDRGRGQGNVGPVGAVGLGRFGASLRLLLLPSLTTLEQR